MTAGETFVPIDRTENYILRLLDPSIKPEIVIHRGNNSIVLAEKEGRKSVVKISRFNGGNLRNEASIRRRLSDLDHVVRLEEEYEGYTSQYCTDRDIRPHQDINRLLRVPNNIIARVLSIATLGLLDTLTNNFVTDNKIKEVHGLRTEFVDGASVGWILSGREMYKKNKELCEEYPWGRTSEGQYFHFNGRFYEEIAEADLPSGVRRTFSRGYYGFYNGAGLVGKAEVGFAITDFAPKGVVEPEQYLWHFKDGVVYYGDKKIVSAPEVVEQLRPDLDQIHDRGIAGIEIRPPNVLISRDGVAKLFDFDRVYTSCFRRSEKFKHFADADREDLEHLFDANWSCRSSWVHFMYGPVGG